MGSEDRPYGAFSYPDYVDHRDALERDALQSLAAFGEIAASVAVEDGAPARLRGLIVTGNFFDVLGVGASIGRTFGDEDDRVPGQHPVAVLSDRIWRGRFGADADVVGQTIRVNGASFSVTGVLPAGFDGPNVLERYDIYFPMMMQAHIRPPRARFSGEMDPDLLERRGARWLSAVGRLRDGVSRESAQASASVLAHRLAETHPDSNENRTLATVFPLARIDPRGWPVLRAVATLLMGVVSLVLLVSTANVASLLLARAVSRRREIALRLALGGGRLRIARQLLTESLVLSLVGGTAGLAVAVWALSTLTALVPQSGIFSFDLDIRIDPRVIAFTTAVSVLAALFAGLAPARRASRADLAPTIKDPESVPSGRSRLGGRRALVLAQLALSIVLLVNAGLFLRSFLGSRAVDPGFAAEEILTADLSIDMLRYTTERGQQFYRDTTARVEALPGVVSTSLARVVPLQGGGRTSFFELDGRPLLDEERPVVATNVVGIDYFRTMGIPLVRGRDFTERDAAASDPVVVINQSFASRYFGDDEPLGKRLRIGGAEAFSTIVGVAADSKYFTIGEAPRPFVYQTLAQSHETGMALLVRAELEPGALTDEVRSTLLAIEPNLPVSNIRPLGDLLASGLFPARMAARLMSVFAAVALGLAVVGLYGVMSFAVSQRTKEMGIRLALGAKPRELAKLAVGEGVTLIGAGVLIGCLAAFIVTRFVASFLYGVSPTDPATFLTVVVVLSTVTLVTAYLPARRAAAADPLIALRHE